MDKTFAPYSISSFWTSDFGFWLGQTEIRHPKSDIQYPLSPAFIGIQNILAVLVLFFSNFDILNAQKSPISMRNWQIIDSLPAPNIGVAGAFSGVGNDGGRGRKFSQRYAVGRRKKAIQQRNICFY
jgi:hypothetical protein